VYTYICVDTLGSPPGGAQVEGGSTNLCAPPRWPMLAAVAVAVEVVVGTVLVVAGAVD
jgi:hypothetical protein